MKQFLIGSYAPEGEPSIFGVELDEEKQKLRLLWKDGQVQNPSFLYLHPNCHVLYAVEERVPNGGLAVMIKTEEGWLLKERLLAGSAPCHLEMTPDARYLLVSNYMDGTIGVYRTDESGMNVVQTDLVRHQGKGVNPTRQEGPHVHSCLVIGEKIYSADLGLDTIFVYELNPADGKLGECGQIHMPDGCGIRHLAHQPGSPYLYANAEMGGDVFVIDLRDGQIKQTHRVVPADFSEAFRTSAIKISKGYVCVSSRECNVLAIMKIQNDGMLAAPSIYPYAQKTPRDIFFDEKYVITTDEGSKSLTLLSLDEHMRISQRDRLLLGNAMPTCIQPV